MIIANKKAFLTLEILFADRN